MKFEIYIANERTEEDSVTAYLRTETLDVCDGFEIGIHMLDNLDVAPQNQLEAIKLVSWIGKQIRKRSGGVRCSGCGVAEGQVCRRSCSVAAQKIVTEAREEQQVEEATEKYKKILKKKEMPPKVVPPQKYTCCDRWEGDVHAPQCTRDLESMGFKFEVVQGPTTEEQQSEADAEDSLPENRKPEIDTRKPEAETGDSLYVFQPPVPVHPPLPPAADCRLCVGTGRLLVLDETVDPGCYRMMWCPCVHRHASSSSPSRSSDVEDRGPIEDTGPAQEDVRDERGSSSEASEEVYEWKTCAMNHKPVWHAGRYCGCGRLSRPWQSICSSCNAMHQPDKAGLCPVCDSPLLDVP